MDRYRVNSGNSFFLSLQLHHTGKGGKGCLNGRHFEQ